MFKPDKIHKILLNKYKRKLHSIKTKINYYFLIFFCIQRINKNVNQICYSSHV